MRRPPFPVCAVSLVTAALLVLCPEPVLAGVADLIPTPIALPAPRIILKLLLLLTFYLHIVLVSILIGSLLLALTARAPARPEKDGPESGLSARLRTAPDTGFLPAVLALAVNLGVAPYLFAQVLYGHLLYSSSILMAAWWLAVPFLAMMAYYGLYILNANAPGVPARPLLLLILLLLGSVAFLLSSNSTLLLRPEAWTAWLRHAHGSLLNLGDPSFWPRFAHILTGCAAVGGLTLAWRAQRAGNKPGADKTEQEARISRGLTWFIRATLLQIPLGIWFLASLPSGGRAPFLGGNALSGATFALALLGAVIALFLARARRVTAAFGAALGVILLMVCMRDMLREALLLPYASSPRMSESAGAVSGGTAMLPLTDGQGGSLALFLFCTSVALLALTCLAWLWRTATAEPDGPGSAPGSTSRSAPDSLEA